MLAVMWVDLKAHLKVVVSVGMLAVMWDNSKAVSMAVYLAVMKVGEKVVKMVVLLVNC